MIGQRIAGCADLIWLCMNVAPTRVRMDWWVSGRRGWAIQGLFELLHPVNNDIHKLDRVLLTRWQLCCSQGHIMTPTQLVGWMVRMGLPFLVGESIHHSHSGRLSHKAGGRRINQHQWLIYVRETFLFILSRYLCVSLILSSSNPSFFELNEKSTKVDPTRSVKAIHNRIQPHNYYTTTYLHPITYSHIHSFIHCPRSHVEWHLWSSLQNPPRTSHDMDEIKGILNTYLKQASSAILKGGNHDGRRFVFIITRVFACLFV